MLAAMLASSVTSVTLLHRRSTCSRRYSRLPATRQGSPRRLPSSSLPSLTISPRHSTQSSPHCSTRCPNWWVRQRRGLQSDAAARLRPSSTLAAARVRARPHTLLCILSLAPWVSDTDPAPHRAPLTSCRSTLAAHRSWLTARHSWLAARHSPLATRRSPLAARRSLRGNILRDLLPITAASFEITCP